MTYCRRVSEKVRVKMELVINISECTYKAKQRLVANQKRMVDEVDIAIANGTPLPKGHGDLIDVNRKITVPVYDEQYEEWGEETLTVREALNRWSDEGITVKDIVILADKAESVEGKE